MQRAEQLLWHLMQAVLITILWMVPVFVFVILVVWLSELWGNWFVVVFAALVWSGLVFVKYLEVSESYKSNQRIQKTMRKLRLQ